MAYGRGGFGGRGGGDIGPKPVSAGEELEVTIEAVASKGDGIAKKEGFVIFVPDTKVGDKVKVKITEVRRSFAIAQKVGEAGGAGEPSA
ncbi:MAG: TRAM domain-containing protein [Candidatus Micrarchaeia archaeon]